MHVSGVTTFVCCDVADAPNAFEIVGNTALVKRSFRERLFFG